jgi:hypothetical protein
VFGGIDPTGDVLRKFVAFFAGKIAEQDAMREAARNANNLDGVQAATAEIESYQKRLWAILKIQKWLVDPSGISIQPTQKKFLDEARKKSSEIQLAEDLLKKLIEEGQGRSAAASSLWRKIKSNAEDLKDSLVSAIEDFTPEMNPDNGGDLLVGPTSPIDIPVRPSTGGTGVQGTGSGETVPVRTNPVSISGTDAGGVDLNVPSRTSRPPVLNPGELAQGEVNDEVEDQTRDRVRDDLKLNLTGMGQDLRGCVDQFGLEKAYPCAIRKSTTECKRTTCSNQKMEAEFVKLRDDFFARKERELASCGKSHFLKNAKVYGKTRDQVAKIIKTLKARISRAKATRQTAKVLKLQADLRKYQFRYNSKDYFATTACKTLARGLQCQLASIWSVQDRLSYRKRNPLLVKKALFGKLPRAQQQNACFNEVILGIPLEATARVTPRSQGIELPEVDVEAPVSPDSDSDTSTAGEAE